ncbi:MAG: ABC transporter permease [Chitinophagaceae bacterium]|nr:ABC transporter permease [Chitinophagaceae bacterium]MBP6590426.1 ABC transporter permease [Chitinophagaceae bacterium]MBP8244108.1 ABC transporter permease [Chitinophagaceae bacterium]
MRKTILIIKREYMTRVRKKTFIIGTLLFPILYLLLIFGTGYIAEKSRQQLKIAVLDSSGFFTSQKINLQNQADQSSIMDLVKTTAGKSYDYDASGYDAMLIIPAMKWDTAAPNNLVLKANKSYGAAVESAVQTKVNRIWDEVKNENLGIDAGKREILALNRIQVKAVNENDEKMDAGLSSGIGMACGFLIYFIILIYGSQVMMGVMEEKTNRIAEIIVSSVKPFQMMLGKIIGIGLVALTQFLLWIAFVFVIYNVTANLTGSGGGGAANQIVGSIQTIFTSVNLPLTLFCFAFYFLGGFFFYASIYGAIGSAINEDVREAQSLSFPVTMLVIISIVLMTTAVNDPTGPIAVWGSIIPLSSPIVMMARIPYGVPGTVPVWQLALSMGLLIAGFIFTTWFAAKIYRTGILMYGKKTSWKEMLRWAFRRN